MFNSGWVSVCVGALLVCWDTVWVGYILPSGGTSDSSEEGDIPVQDKRSNPAWCR